MVNSPIMIKMRITLRGYGMIVVEWRDRGRLIIVTICELDCYNMRILFGVLGLAVSSEALYLAQ